MLKYAFNVTNYQYSLFCYCFILEYVHPAFVFQVRQTTVANIFYCDMSVVAHTCIFHAFRLGLLWMEVRVGVCLITFVLDALFCEIMNWRKCLQGAIKTRHPLLIFMTTGFFLLWDTNCVRNVSSSEQEKKSPTNNNIYSTKPTYVRWVFKTL